MNIKLKLALLHQSTDKGAVLPIIIGLGLIMTLAGTTMIIRSSSEQLTASAQKGTTQSLSAAEAGVTQAMQFINLVRVVADQDLVNWQTEFDSVKLACGDSPNITAYANKDWIPINSGQDRFKILDYDYTAETSHINSPGTGVLKVEGQANFKTNPSTNIVEVSIPVNPKTEGAPGLYATSVDLSQNGVNGDVLLYSCNITNVDETNVNGNVTNDAYAKFPDLPQIPTPVTAIDLGTIDGAHSLFDGSGVLTLPVIDGSHSGAKDSNGRYHYIVDEISLSGNKIIKITPGEKVSWYLTGDVSIAGAAKLMHNCLPSHLPPCKPTNFQIFGGDGSANSASLGYQTYSSGAVINGTTTDICLSGNSTVAAFIFAPKAHVAVQGGGSSKDEFFGEGITGTVWAKAWNTGDGSTCGSSTSKTLINQSAAWLDLPLPAPRTISAPSSWQRRTATTP